MRISIITVVYNAKKILEQTIKSVLEQNYPYIEYIIIDGGSTDGTVDIIKKYEDKIDYWVCERDKGIYDAMNKGIEKATGDGILFLNAGDCFVGNVITEDIVVPCFLNVKYHNFFNKLIDVPLKNYKLGIPNCHQGIVFENKQIKYNLSYRVASDYDYYLQHGYKKLDIISTPGYIYYDNTGFSIQNSILRDKEIADIISNNFNNVYVLLFKIKAFAKKYIKKFIGK